MGEKTWVSFGEPAKTHRGKSSSKVALGGDMLVPGRVMTICVFMCMRFFFPSSKSWIQTGHFTGKYPILFMGQPRCIAGNCWILHVKKNYIMNYRGLIILPAQTMRCWGEVPSKLAWICSVWSPKQGVMPRLILPYPKAQHLPPRWKRLIRKSRMYWSSNAAAALTHGCWWWQTFIKTAAWMWFFNGILRGPMGFLGVQFRS